MLIVAGILAFAALGISAFADTRSLVPRAAGEGSIGTSAKPWGHSFVSTQTVGTASYSGLTVSNLTIVTGITLPWNGFTGVITNGIGAASTTRLWIVSGTITNATTLP